VFVNLSNVACVINAGRFIRFLGHDNCVLANLEKSKSIKFIFWDSDLLHLLRGLFAQNKQ